MKVREKDSHPAMPEPDLGPGYGAVAGTGDNEHSGKLGGGLQCAAAPQIQIREDRLEGLRECRKLTRVALTDTLRIPSNACVQNKKLRCAIKALQARRSLLWAAPPALKDAKEAVRSA